MRISDLCRAAVLGAAIGFAAVSAARADMQVLESNADAYPVGARVADDTQLKLQPGERVKVLLRPSNRTQVFEGPRVKTPGPAGGTRGPQRREPGGLPSANSDEARPETRGATKRREPGGLPSANPDEQRPD